MDASLTSTHGQTAEIRVVDNRANEHAVTVDTHGRIQTHETNAYPRNPSERSPAMDEHLRHVQRFARYTLAEEAGQLSALAGEHPRLLDTLVGVLGTLSETRFEELFGPFRDQLGSHSDPDLQPPLAVQEAEDESFSYYAVILDFDVSDAAGMNGVQQLADAVGGAFVENQVSSLFGGESTTGLDFMADVRQVANARGYDLNSLIELTVLETWLCSIDGETGEVTVIDADPVDEVPVGAIELPPIDPGSPAEFRRTLQHHILCQARDSYIGMGVEPPAYFKVLGHGLSEFTQRYRTLECYENYHDPDATVSVWDPAELVTE